MKKYSTVLLLAALLALGSCTAQTDGETESAPDTQETTTEDTESTAETDGTENAETSGTEADADTEPEATYDLAALTADNNIHHLLETHSSVTGHTETYDGTGDAPLAVKDTQYQRTDGRVQMLSKYVYAADNGENASYTEAYADADYSGALYEISGADKYFTAFPSAYYDTYIDGTWFPGAGEMSEETVDSVAEQDGTLVITTTTTYRQETELYARNLYYVDPETGALLYAESTSYSLPLGESVPQADYGMDTNEVMAVQKTTITYDTPISFDLLPHEQILASTDYAEVTFNIAPTTDANEIHWYPIAHGTHIFYQSDTAYTIYDDEELTNDVSGTALISTGEAATYFVTE